MMKRVVDKVLRRCLPIGLAAACWLLAVGDPVSADGGERALAHRLAVKEVRASGALVLREVERLCLSGIAAPEVTDWRAGWFGGD